MVDTIASRNQDEQVFKSLNGNIIISYNGSEIAIAASNNLTKLKDSDWFNEMIAVKIVNNNNVICSGTKKNDYYLSTDEDIIMVPRRTWPSK